MVEYSHAFWREKERKWKKDNLKAVAEGIYEEFSETFRRITFDCVVRIVKVVIDVVVAANGEQEYRLRQVLWKLTWGVEMAWQRWFDRNLKQINLFI